MWVKGRNVRDNLKMLINADNHEIIRWTQHPDFWVLELCKPDVRSIKYTFVEQTIRTKLIKIKYFDFGKFNLIIDTLFLKLVNKEPFDLTQFQTEEDGIGDVCGEWEKGRVKVERID